MKITKILSLVLCFILTLGVLSGCGGNGATSSDVSGTSSTSSVNQGLGGFGQKLVMTSPSGSLFYGNEFNVTWKGTKAGETVSVLLEKKNGNSFTKVLEKTGLKMTPYQHYLQMLRTDIAGYNHIGYYDSQKTFHPLNQS